MTPTFEQAIEVIRQLPPPEQAKGRDWIDEESQKNSFDEDKQEKLKRQQERFQHSLEWIRANREEFDGQWVKSRFRYSLEVVLRSDDMKGSFSCQNAGWWKESLRGFQIISDYPKTTSDTPRRAKR